MSQILAAHMQKEEEDRMLPNQDQILLDFWSFPVTR